MRSPRPRSRASTPAPRSCTTTSTCSVRRHEAAARYREGWEPVLEQRPDALLYPTINGIGPSRSGTRTSRPLAETIGLRIGVIDPGSVNLGAGLRVRELRERHRVPAARSANAIISCPACRSSSPGSCRAALSYWRAGKLPPGTMLRFYFGGEPRSRPPAASGSACRRRRRRSTRTSRCSTGARCRGRWPSSATTSSPPSSHARPGARWPPPRRPRGPQRAVPSPTRSWWQKR